MATKDDIITLPHSSLRQRSTKIGAINDDIITTIENMKQATLDWEASRSHEVGVALAAVQINVLQRIVVIRNNFDNKEDTFFQVFINPKISKFEGEVIEDYEGCLSIKNVYGLVPRYSKVRVSAMDEHGKQVKVKAEGFLARVFQHEIDHTNGTVFIDHIKDNPEAFFTLDEKGNLNPKDYDKDIKNNPDLWA